MFCRIWCGAISWTSVLTWAASHLTYRSLWHPSLKVKKGHQVPSQGHPRDHPHSLPPHHRRNQGPLHENIRWDVSPFLPKQQFSSEVKDKKRVCLHVYAYLCAYFCVCTECVRVFVCVCVCVHILEWNDQGRAEAVRLIVWTGEQHPLSRPPRPLFFPLAEPQFEPQRVHSVQVVSEQPFVSNKTQVLIQLQGWFVGDFSLQYNLGTHRWPYQYVVVYMNGLTGLLQNLVQRMCCGLFYGP